MLILRGLTSIKVGDTDSGDMGSSLAALGKTYQNTARLIFPEQNDVEFYNEEEDDPFQTIQDITEAKYLEWEIYDFDNANLELLFGGTAGAGPPKTWAAPSTVPDVEQSIEVLDKNSAKIEIPRAKLTASIDAPLTRNEPARIKIRAKILTPTSDAPITITEPAA